MQKTKFVRQNVLPVLAAFIWGTGFVAQSVGADYVGPFTFNAARSAIAFIFLLILCTAFRARRKKDFHAQAKPRPNHRRDLLLGGLFCGVVLTLGTNLQQKGLETTTSGKAGFITALYIVIVPILGVFLKKKVGKTVWVGVTLAVVGLYCLCIQEDFSISKGDFYIFLCSLCFSAHILIIDHFTKRVDGVELSCAQFLMLTIFSSVGMLAWKLPIVFLLENNCYGVSTEIHRITNTDRLAVRAKAYGIPGVTVDGTDVEAVFHTVAGAVERARSGDGPSLVETMVYRYQGHYCGDPAAYRPKEYLIEGKSRDPVDKARTRLLELGVKETEIGSIDRSVAEEIESAYQFAKSSPDPDPAAVIDNVYSSDNERSVLR